MKFLGQIIDQNSTDSSKVESTSAIHSPALMKRDGTTPSLKKIRSFLVIVNYSAITRPLFTLLKGQKARVKTLKKLNHVPQHRKGKPSDWTQAQDQSFARLKTLLVESVVLAHPDFK